MKIPTISHPTGRHNFSVVTIPGEGTYWFSYQTCIAFDRGTGLNVSENVWGPTTGKHLNYIDGGPNPDRIDRETFERMLTGE